MRIRTGKTDKGVGPQDGRQPIKSSLEPSLDENMLHFLTKGEVEQVDKQQNFHLQQDAF
jgi:hypothetical protein